VRFAPIVPYTFSLFLNPLHSAFGWKREPSVEHSHLRRSPSLWLLLALDFCLIASHPDALPSRRS
jgi:hypothetical protein